MLSDIKVVELIIKCLILIIKLFKTFGAVKLTVTLPNNILRVMTRLIAIPLGAFFYLIFFLDLYTNVKLYNKANVPNR